MVLAIPELDNYPLASKLKNAFPNIKIELEKDTNIAAIGESFFNKAITQDFIFITLGTGVGASAIINSEVFYDSNGSGMQLGFCPSKNNKTLQDNIGVIPRCPPKA